MIIYWMVLCFLVWLCLGVITFLIIFSRNQKEPRSKKKFIIFWAGYHREKWLITITWVPEILLTLGSTILVYFVDSAGPYLIGVSLFIFAAQIFTLFILPYLRKDKKITLQKSY
jgi:hypothetical protein